MFDASTARAPAAAARGALDELNTEQRRAATFDGDALLIVAGAGTGKTKTLACRVGHLVERGTPPARVLLLTFTRRAAREMLARAELMAGSAAGKVWGGTFHAIGNRLLRVHGRALGLAPHFTVMDQADGADMMNLIRSELELGAGSRRFPRKDTLTTIYSRTVNARSPLSEVLEKHFPWCTEEVDGIRSIFQGYIRRKRAQGVLDFDDLLLYWDALARSSGAGDAVAGMFDHILVDEYQDTNRLQADILRNMRRCGSKITVVGDDAQAIYSFRSATVANILDFPSHHPDTEVVKLERNYRSTDAILRASNAVIAGARRRYDKDLWTTRESDIKPSLITCDDETRQSDEVCRRVLEQRERGIELRNQAVLFRTSHHSAGLEVELARRNIPFVKYGGLRFIEAAHVKDLLSVLRILENPHDELSWFRVLQLVEGLGAATARHVMDALGVRHSAGRAPGRAPESPLARLAHDPPTVPGAARREFGALRDMLADCADCALAPAAEIERVRRFYDPIFRRVYDGAAARVADLEQLEQIASGYPSRQRFLSDLTLDPPVSTGDLAGPPLLDEDYLVLSTIHSAKGCEWDAVHVIHAADGMIPSDMALGDDEELEEERRLLYVALTRARQDLSVLFPLRLFHRRTGLDDAHSYAQLTRFIPVSIRGLFEQRGTAPRPDEPPPAVPSESASVDALLEALWEA
ncbi:MAG: ATP-dependent helicase [Actinomycetota bacterium]